MQGFERPNVSARPIAPADIAGFVEAMALHEVRCLIGLDPLMLADHLSQPPRRPVLRLDLGGPAGGLGTAAAFIAEAIDKLARAVAELWPYLWGGEDLGGLRDDALTLAHLPLRMEALAGRHRGLSRAWGAEIVPRLLRGAAPRLAQPSPQVEWPQLALAFSPEGLVLVVPWQAGTGFAASIEWLARNARVCVIVVAETMPQDTAFERLSFGAAMVDGPEPPQAPEAPRLEPHRYPPPTVLALPETEGSPHPQSAAELKLYTLLQADADLRPLFAFNRIVPDLPLLAARADVLWRDGRLVVEIDGPEHRGVAKYRADRHRDARLTLAGWRVLRFTNEDIMTDAALALETIRELVRQIEGEAG